jgi:anti-sigma factor RsiW
MGHEAHIPDDELLMAMDGELAEPRKNEVLVHLSHCWECRARQSRFERSIADFMGVYRPASEDGDDAAGPGLTARLRAELAREGARGVSGGPSWRVWGCKVAPAAVARSAAIPAAVLLAAAMFFWMGSRRLQPAGPLPNARWTQGAVRILSKQQVCNVTPEDEGLKVPAPLARRVFEQYGIINPKPRAYEVDYLISPSLGGDTSLENLWPVPYAEGVWTSRVKDALEDHLRTLVCEGKLDLATAQQEIASDWIAAYQKHFRTRVPVAAHALFVKDSPWE